MGWFGMPGFDKESAFEELFSQKQYEKKFELLWKKHCGSKSLAVFKLDNKFCGEVILWETEGNELMYKGLFVSAFLLFRSRNAFNIY